MAVLVLDCCPHCRAEQMTCEFVCDYEVRPADPHAHWGEGFKGHTHDLGEWNAFFVCRRCKEGVVAKVLGKANAGEPPGSWDGDLHEGFELKALHPTPKAVQAPKHVSSAVASNYKEATRNLQRGEYTSAAFMCRKVLDRSTKELVPDGVQPETWGKKSLYHRLEKLAELHMLTTAMGQWADIVRDEGNEAVHDEDADKATATELHHFTEMFLIYAFTMPDRVAEYQDHGEPND